MQECISLRETTHESYLTLLSLSLVEDYDKVCERICEVFCLKHSLSYNPQEAITSVHIGDEYLSLLDMVTDLRYNAVPGEVRKFHDYYLRVQEAHMGVFSYTEWLIHGGPVWSDEELAESKRKWEAMQKILEDTEQESECSRELPNRFGVRRVR